MATAGKKLFTAEDLLRLADDGQDYELLDGELAPVTPPGAEHGGVQGNVVGNLRAHIKPRELGAVLGEVGVILHRNPDRVRAPDVCFITRDRVPPDGLPKGYLEVVPDLVIEIVSPFDKASEIEQKVQEWLQAGARLVWVMYPDTRSVVAYRSLTDIRVYTEADTLDGAPVVPDFTCPVGSLFE